MFEKYHDAIISDVVTRLLLLMLDPLFLWSLGGVCGMSNCNWSFVSNVCNLGLLILLVVHVCASTILQEKVSKNKMKYERNCCYKCNNI